MKTLEKELLEISISNSWGFNKEIADSIMEKLNILNPLNIRFITPTFITAHYKKENDTYKVAETINEIIQIVEYRKRDLGITKIVKCIDSFVVKRKWFNKNIEIVLGGIKKYDKRNIVYMSKNENTI